MSKASKASPSRSRTLSRAQVGAIFGVSSSTISRWGREGKLPCIVTLGGQRRYFREDVVKLAESARRRRSGWKRRDNGDTGSSSGARPSNRR
jgi:predicted DNA-binding transcriptional regulator AlpA